MPWAANPIANLPLGNRFAQCDDFSDKLMAGNDWAMWVSRLSMILLRNIQFALQTVGLRNGVGVTDTAGLDLDQHFAGRGFGQPHVLHNQRAPRFLEQGGFVRGRQRHGSGSGSGSGSGPSSGDDRSGKEESVQVRTTEGFK